MQKILANQQRMHYYAIMHTMMKYCKALSDETRMRIFRLLAKAKGYVCECELVDAIQKPQYTVSRALAQLEYAELVESDRRGKLVFFRSKMNKAVIELGQWVLDYGSWNPADAGKHNYDGSQPPGASPWVYDWERLVWRLALRDQEQVCITYPKQDGKDENRLRVLFVCVHNSARSQIAEEYFRRFGGDVFLPSSAGLTPGTLNPFVVRALAEEGIDISSKKTQAVVDLYRQGFTYDYVITVCSREAEEGCPIFPGPVRRLNWPFEDPSSFTGSNDEIMDQVRRVRDQIKQRVQEFLGDFNAAHAEKLRVTK